MGTNQAPAPAPAGPPLVSQLVMSAFLAIAWHNVLWLNVGIWVVFKRWSGVYFYTLIVASWGIAIHQIGFMLMFFDIAKTFAEAFAPITIGWYAMVTGQSLMLYSRLHLIVRDKRKTRWVLYMICMNALLFHVPTTIFFTQQYKNPALRSKYAIWEKIQVTVFGTQEIIISLLYVCETHKLLKPSEQFRRERFRQSMRQLMYANILIIILDITILSIQYANLFQIQVIFKGAAYSVKLLIEFFVLNQLMDIVGGSGGFRSGTHTEEPKNYDSNELKYSIKKKSRVASSSFAGYENATVDVFSKASNDVRSVDAVQKKKGFALSAPVISADRGTVPPPDLNKIHVVQTVECITACSSLSPSNGEHDATEIIMPPKTKQLSPSSSEINFATRGY